MTAYLNTNWEMNSTQLVEVYDELSLWAAPFGLKLLDGIRYKKGIRAVDIGFGPGFPLTELAMRLGKDSQVYGIDPWNAAVDRAEKKIAFYGIKNVEIIRGVAEDIPLADDTVDLIVSNNGLNNVAAIDKALAECARIMKTGGQFIQTMNLKDTMMDFYAAMEKVLVAEKLDDCLLLMREQIDKKRKPLEMVLDKIRAHGFHVESVVQDKFEYKFVDGTTMFHHHFIRLAFLDGWKGIVQPDRQVEIFGKIEAELNERAHASGILKLQVPFVVIDCTKL